MQPTLSSKANPLANFMRQPKIYIRLPSQGQFWPTKSIVISETGEFPVYSMTAKDELTFKTPDALLNGQAIVDVIQSCIPNIKNAWDCPTIDMDTILIAIRLATYGEKMPFKHTVPNTDMEEEYELDLRVLLDQQQENQWIEEIPINEQLVIYVKPLTYKHMTQTSIKSFETNRILNMVNDDSLTDEKKMEIFNSSFSSLTKATIDLLTDSISKIVTSESEVTDRKFIAEFVGNTDKQIFELVQNHVGELKKHNELKPLDFVSNDEQREAGAPETYQIPIDFNNSNFFG